jgi:Pyridoxamine 5'-phosphate oxidase like
MLESDLTDAGELRARIARKLRGLEFVHVTTSDGRGQLRGRPLALHRADFNGELWLVVDPETDVMAEVEHDPRVNVSCMDVADGFYLSVSGIARASDGGEPRAESAVPDARPTKDSFSDRRRLLKVEINCAQIWSTSRRRAPEVLSFVRSALTGGPHSPGLAVDVRL